MKNDEIIFKNKIFFNKYKIFKYFCKGAFGNVFEGENIINKELVALKFESRTSIQKKTLEKEAYFLYNLKGFGIPKLFSYGYSGGYNILIETLLGKSLYQLRLTKKFTLKDICMVGIQVIERLNYIHSKNIIHCDIKPQNLLIGNNDPSNIYICDFGIAQIYRNPDTGKHIKMTKLKRIYVTLIYSSINSILGYQQSRRDDLESLGYILLHLNKDLPWEHVKFKTIDEYKAITLNLKNNISLENLCEGLPLEFINYMKYVKELKFSEKPNYTYLKNLFFDVLYRINEKNDGNFSFNKNKKNKSCPKNSKLNFSQKKNITPHGIFNQIKRLITKTNTSKNYSISKNNINKSFNPINNYINKSVVNNRKIDDDSDLKVENDFYVDYKIKETFTNFKK